ncbi:hypothetical protein [Cupriavidus sp. TMH.W2]|uniref:hypothetical protein n=1 Tax=Cupriavidus sp. TMH.W2 TaxID=3434465 RepID=UPI003D7854B2
MSAAKVAAKKVVRPAQPAARKTPKVTAVNYVDGFEDDMQRMTERALHVMRTYRPADEDAYQMAKQSALAPLLHLAHYLEHYHAILNAHGDMSAGARRRHNKALTSLQSLVDHTEHYELRNAAMCATTERKRESAWKRYASAQLKSDAARAGMTVAKYKASLEEAEATER